MDIQNITLYDIKHYYPFFNTDTRDAKHIQAYTQSVAIIKDYNENTNYTGKLSLQERLFHSLKKHGTRKNFEVYIQPDDILLTKYCPMTGQQIDYYGSFHKNKAPTLTKKDFSKGYVPGNVQVVCLFAKDYVIKRTEGGQAHTVAIMKNRYTEDNPKQYEYEMDVETGQLRFADMDPQTKAHITATQKVREDIQALAEKVRIPKEYFGRPFDENLADEITEHGKANLIDLMKISKEHLEEQNEVAVAKPKKVKMFVMIERLSEQIPQTIERLQEIGELNSEVVTELYHKLND